MRKLGRALGVVALCVGTSSLALGGTAVAGVPRASYAQCVTDTKTLETAQDAWEARHYDATRKVPAATMKQLVKGDYLKQASTLHKIKVSARGSYRLVPIHGKCAT